MLELIYIDLLSLSISITSPIETNVSRNEYILPFIHAHVKKTMKLFDKKVETSNSKNENIVPILQLLNLFFMQKDTNSDHENASYIVKKNDSSNLL